MDPIRSSYLWGFLGTLRKIHHIEGIPNDIHSIFIEDTHSGRSNAGSNFSELLVSFCSARRIFDAAVILSLSARSRAAGFCCRTVAISESRSGFLARSRYEIARFTVVVGGFFLRLDGKLSNLLARRYSRRRRPLF